MAIPGQDTAHLLRQIANLELRLEEAEDALRAIRSGGIDALVTQNGNEVRVFTLQGADHAHRIVLESMSEGVVTLGADATILYANSRFAELVDERLERVLGAAFSDFLHPRARAKWLELNARFDNRTSVTELELKATGDRTVYARLSFSPMPDGNGVVALVVVVMDITEQRQAEERFRRLFDGAADACIVHDRAGRILDANEAACASLGYPREQLLTLRFSDVEVGRQPDELIAIWQQARFGSAVTVEGTHRRANGTIFPVEMRVALFAAGEQRLLISASRDLTERQQAQLEQQRLQSLLFQAQKMEAIGQLAGGVAHDFNNILSAMLLELSLYEANPQPAEVSDIMKELRADAKRAVELTSRLLAFSRQQVIFPKTVELNALICDFLKMLKRLIGEHVVLDFQTSATDLRVEADAGMIGQVITNLVLNARDAMPSGGRIAIRTMELNLEPQHTLVNPEARAGRFARIDVTDTGCGIDDSIAQHIFEPFFTTKELGTGTGLGLAVVYGIVKQHNGWVEFESVVGSSSTFRVVLPATAPAIEPTDETERPKIPRGRHERVMVVEDDAVVRRLVVTALMELGYQVHAATDAIEALKCWDSLERNVDLVLSDMGLPGPMNGLRLTDRLRREKPGLKLILMSGYSRDVVMSNAIGDQAAVFLLPKPVDFALLARRVREVLDGNCGLQEPH